MRTVDLELRDVGEGAAVGSRRGEEERFWRYARYLTEEDRLLVDLVYRRRMTRHDVARLQGKNVGVVSRRLKKVEARLKDPLVGMLMEAREGELSPVHRAIGIAHFLGGRPAKGLGRELGMSSAQVREVVAYLKGWKEGRRAGK